MNPRDDTRTLHKRLCDGNWRWAISPAELDQGKKSSADLMIIDPAIGGVIWQRVGLTFETSFTLATLPISEIAAGQHDELFGGAVNRQTLIEILVKGSTPGAPRQSASSTLERQFGLDKLAQSEGNQP